MKSLLTTGRFRLVTVALIAGAFLGWIALQQIVTVTAHAAEKTTAFKPALNQLKASVKAPPEIQALKDTKALPTKIRTRTTKNVLLNKVAKQKGGQEIVQSAQSGKQEKMVLRAATKEPPEMKQVRETEALPTKARVRTTRNVLLDKVARQPGGQEKLRMAKPKGFKTGTAPGTSGFPLASFADLNPFKAGVAHAETGTEVVLTPQYPSKTSPFGADLYILGELSGRFNTSPSYSRLYNYTLGSTIGTNIYKPGAKLVLRIPSTGWYMINFETYRRGAKATLKHWTGVSTEQIQTWDERSSTGYIDHPALVNLSAGWHYFYWIVEPGTGSNMYLYRVSIEKI